MGQQTNSYEECRKKAIEAGALEPHGFKENVSANWLQSQGQRFANTPLAQSRLAALIEDCQNGRPFRKLW